MLRLLTSSDVPDALALSSGAGWNQTAADWVRLLEYEPAGCFCIEQQGQVVATATVVCYGGDLAWVGMVLTLPEHRRRGYARQLVARALEYAAARDIRTVKLDATVQGRPLYLSLGFADEQPVERWHRTARGEPSRLDLRAFGADRTRLLLLLGGAGRPGLLARYLGPVVAPDTERAAALVDAVLTPDEAWFWDLLPSNQAAVQLAQERGFAPVRRLMRMYRGEAVRGDDKLVYAIAGFEWG